MTPTTDGLTQVANRIAPLADPVVIRVEEPARRPDPAGQRVMITALVFLGILLRIFPLASERSLWIDEAMLALNLVERDPRGLLEPLSWNQGAPVGFLLVSKSVVVLLGSSEWALRLVGFLGSIVGLMGFAWVARRLLPAKAALIAIALYAISPYLVSYSGECKQYATDAALTVGMLAAAAGLLRGESGLRRWIVLAITGAGAIWFSHPVAFVLGGIGSALFIEAIMARDRRRAAACAATIFCWLVSFAVCYLVSLRHLGTNQYLLDYWAGHFLPLPPTSQGDLLWLADHYFTFLGYPGGLRGTEIQAGGIAGALGLIGIAALWREQRPVAMAVAIPAMLALTASGLHKYPFAGRLLLFLVPLMLLAVARGAWVLTDALQARQPLAAAIVLGLLFLAPAVETYQTLRKPPRTEQVEPLLASLRNDWQPGDKVYIYYGAVPAFTYYTRENPFPPGVILGNEHRGSQLEYRNALKELAGKPRVWLVFSHCHKDEESVILAYAQCQGKRVKAIRYDGAIAYLYDFRSES